MKTIFRLLAVQVVCAAFAPCTASFAQERDARLFSAAQTAQPAVIKTLHDLVLIESGSANIAGLTRVADFAEARLKALGAQTERIKSADGERVLIKGVLTGTGRLKAMLIGHMDTVEIELDRDLAAQPAPDCEVDQRINW